MTEDERGRLWYVDFQSRVFYIENNRIHPYAYNDVIAAAKAPINFFHGLIVEGNGKDLWWWGIRMACCMYGAKANTNISCHREQ